MLFITFLRAIRDAGPAFGLAMVLLITACGHDKKSAPPAKEYFPAPKWKHRTPAVMGMDPAKLQELSAHVGGAGVVVRHGCMVHRWGRQTPEYKLWSAAKPLISTLLMFAVQEGRLKSVDAPVAEVEPRLLSLNAGKDTAILWRHLASQTSGYGLVEKPGAAFAYNDFAIALYYDSLMNGVFREDPTELLHSRISVPLGFEDECHFAKGGGNDLPGWLNISVRDFARFGLFILRRGNWNGKQLLKAELVDAMLKNPVPATLPMSSGKLADMIPGQRSYGTSSNRSDTRVGPGFYSFNWWLNLPDAQQRRPLPDAPPDTVLAVGLFGRTALWIIPSLDLVVSWNQSEMTDHLESIENRNTRFNTAARLIRESVTGPGQ